MKTWDEVELIKMESLPLWKNKNFIIIYLSHLISGIGSGIGKIALLTLGYHLGRAPGASVGSAAAVGLLFACLTLPGVFVGLFSGVLADRISKRKLLVISRVMLSIIAASLVLAASWRSSFLLYLSTFMMGTFFSLEGGPFRAYLPEIFTHEQLPKVNSAVSSVQSLTLLLGTALGGIILGLGNRAAGGAVKHVTAAFLIDAATFFISAIMTLFLPAAIPRMAEGAIKLKAIFQDIKSGIDYLVRSPSHRFLMLFFVSILGIYYISGGLVTSLCEEVLSVSNNIRGTTALAIIQASFGLGGLISSFFIPVLMRKFGCLQTLVMGALLCVVELFAFGYITDIYVIAVIATLTAASAPMLMVPTFTFIQEKTAPRLMGRAMGALDTLLLAVISLSFWFGGVLADVKSLGIKNVFIITGFVILVLTLVSLLLPIYRRVRHQERLGPLT